MNGNFSDQLDKNRKNNKGVRFNTTFIRTKIIHGTPYLYEITPYWDYKANKQRQKSKYIGRADKLSSSNTISAISSNKPNQISSKTSLNRVEQNANIYPPPVKHLVDYGDAYLFKAIISELGIDKILSKCFTEEETNFILLSAGYRLLCGKSFSMMESFLESSELHSMFPVSFSLSSPAISNHLEKIGHDEDGNIQSFFLKWSQKFKSEGDNWLFDLTSFTSQAKDIEFLEYGHNSQEETLPQINMGLLVNQTRKLPFYYKLYPGSIKDVTTLTNIIQETRLLSIPTMRMILDRGFYSDTNLSSLFNAEIDFILPLPRTCKHLTEQILKINIRELESARNIYKAGNQLLNCIQGSLPYIVSFTERNTAETNKKITREYTLHYSLYRDTDEQQTLYKLFMQKLIEAEELLKSINWSKFDSAYKRNKYWNKEAKDWIEYLNLTKDSNKETYSIERNDKAIQKAKAELGIKIWIHSKAIPPEDVIPMYRERDMVEKLFDSSKNELSGLPLRVHKTNTLYGLVFILFISIIVQYYLLEKMKKGNVDPRFSISRIFFELHKLKKAIWFGQYKLINEITKTQRTLLKQLNILLPTKGWN